MNISKTLFKNYTRCKRFCSLDNLYMKKMNTDVSIFLDDEKAEAYETLLEMFDIETGDDLIHPTDAQINALLPYYNLFEDYAMKIADKYFGGGIIFNLDNKKQKCFAYNDGVNRFYCYLDGYQEKDGIIRVFEVKATSNSKFLELGFKANKCEYSIFNQFGSTLKLIDFTSMDLEEKFKEKYDKAYAKLFDRYSDTGKYVFDLAVERNFIEHAIKGLNEYKDKKIEYYLVVLNHNYTYDGVKDLEGKWVYNPDFLGNELVNFIDLTDVTLEFQGLIEEYKGELLDYVNKLDGAKCDLGKWCERKKKTQCPFFRICWKEVMQDGSILEYLHNDKGFIGEDGNKVSTMELINDGYLKLDSLEEDQLTRPINVIQRRCYVNHETYFDKERLAKEYLDNVVYPIYHLDFESFHNPLPRFRGEHPYQQSVFQFSLHKENKMGECDIEKNHMEFLARDHNDRREELIQKMIEYIDLSNGGTVLVYNHAFEHTRIEEFGHMFPKYKEALDNINNHMFDLMDLVKGNSKLHKLSGFEVLEDDLVQNYYDSRLHGSYSIKKVLPIFSNLTYKGMPIGNGNEAIVAYARYGELEGEDLEKMQSDLVKYCRQDTYAMAVVLWGILEEVGIKSGKS